jgi:hypothetical protein
MIHGCMIYQFIWEILVLAFTQESYIFGKCFFNTVELLHDFYGYMLSSILYIKRIIFVLKRVWYNLWMWPCTKSVCVNFTFLPCMILKSQGRLTRNWLTLALLSYMCKLICIWWPKSYLWGPNRGSLFTNLSGK